jgi:DNA-binding CsgD family transcriptional regulator
LAFPIGPIPERHRGLVAVTAVQAAAALFFVADILADWSHFSSEPAHLLVEFAAVAGLVFGSIWGFRELRRVLAQNARMHGSLKAASGAFLDLMEESFARWGLTPSERDVALLSIKGLSVSKIAALRGTREGTVKAQSAAIYRKAGVGGRAALLGLFVEELVAGMVLEGGEGRSS